MQLTQCYMQWFISTSKVIREQHTSSLTFPWSRLLKSFANTFRLKIWHCSATRMFFQILFQLICVSRNMLVQSLIQSERSWNVIITAGIINYPGAYFGTRIDSFHSMPDTLRLRSCDSARVIQKTCPSFLQHCMAAVWYIDYPTKLHPIKSVTRLLHHK